ncbi:MAG: glycosyltransferase [Sedimentisphaerales bacterium]
MRNSLASQTEKGFRLLVLAHANRSAGARSVGINLLRALIGIDNGIEVIAVLPVGYDYEEIGGIFSVPPIWFDQKGSFLRRFIFDTITLPHKVRSIKPDVILALGNIGIRGHSIPQAVLVQDAHHVYPRRHYGRMTASQHLRYFVQKRQIKHYLKKTSILYCQTKTMLKHTQETFGIHEHAKILSKGISAGVIEGLNNTDTPQEFKPFEKCFRLICLTRYNPHKNLETIVDMFINASEALQDVVVFVTIAADQHPNAKRLLDKIRQYDLSDRIVNLGPVEQRRIPAYFKNCHALLLPTLIESFSATYLEAMQLDLPIMTSDLDFAHETCGPAALYFDPWSNQSILEAVIKIRKNTDLRNRLARAGRDRLKTVYNKSWDEIARSVASDLRELVHGRKG